MNRIEWRQFVRSMMRRVDVHDTSNPDGNRHARRAATVGLRRWKRRVYGPAGWRGGLS